MICFFFDILVGDRFFKNRIVNFLEICDCCWLVTSVYRINKCLFVGVKWVVIGFWILEILRGV